MDKDTYKTEVMFRKWDRKDFEGDIMALFPYDIETPEGLIGSYQHIGQHGAANYNHCITSSVPAKYGEYKDLLEELESIGHNLRIVQKQNYSKYLRELKRARNIN